MDLRLERLPPSPPGHHRLPGARALVQLALLLLGQVLDALNLRLDVARVPALVLALLRVQRPRGLLLVLLLLVVVAAVQAPLVAA